MALPFPVPTSLSSAFVMSRPTSADVNALAEIYFDAFKGDGSTHWWSPDRDAMLLWMGRRIQRKMSDHSVRHFKVVDVTNGDLVAWARWDIPEGYEKEFGDWVGEEVVDVTQLVESEKDAEGERGAESKAPVTSAPIEPTPSMMDCPEGGNAELLRGFFDAIGGVSEKWQAKQMLGLSLICTAPKYHRRGAAKALMVPMLTIADAVGLKTYLEATPTGKPVYEKLGFQTVDTVGFDLKKQVGKYNEMYELSVMVRDPQTI